MYCINTIAGNYYRQPKTFYFSTPPSANNAIRQTALNDDQHAYK